MSKIGDIARAFNMSVAQFAAYCGYTRQALYNNSIRNSHRSRALNKKIFQMDQEEAKRKYEERKRAIDEYEQYLKAGEN